MAENGKAMRDNVTIVAAALSLHGRCRVRMSFMHRFSPSFVAGYLLLLSAGFATASSEKPLLELRLDGSGHFSESSGSVAMTAEMLGEEGEATDLHGPQGSGVSGLPADRAFNNTAASQMGGNSEHPGHGGILTMPAADLFRRLDSFTLQGWYKADGVPPGTFARLVTSSKVNLYFTPEGLQLKVGNSQEAGSALCVAEAYQTEGAWVFFAVTYDSTRPQDNVQFFAGSKEMPVKLVQTSTLDHGPISSSSNGTVVFGNTEERGRPFKGWLDNLRFWGEARGGAGALSMPELEKYRSVDLKH